MDLEAIRYEEMFTASCSSSNHWRPESRNRRHTCVKKKAIMARAQIRTFIDRMMMKMTLNATKRSTKNQKAPESSTSPRSPTGIFVARPCHAHTSMSMIKAASTYLSWNNYATCFTVWSYHYNSLTVTVSEDNMLLMCTCPKQLNNIGHCTFLGYAFHHFYQIYPELVYLLHQAPNLWSIRTDHSHHYSFYIQLHVHHSIRHSLHL